MLVDHEKQPFRVKLIDFGIASVASSIPQGSVIQALSYRQVIGQTFHITKSINAR